MTIIVKIIPNTELMTTVLETSKPAMIAAITNRIM